MISSEPDAMHYVCLGIGKLSLTDELTAFINAPTPAAAYICRYTCSPAAVYRRRLTQAALKTGFAALGLGGL